MHKPHFWIFSIACTWDLVFLGIFPFRAGRTGEGEAAGAAAGAYLLQHVALPQGHEPPVQLHQLIRVGLEKEQDRR